MACSYSHSIFLSHSGKQKPFVERLYDHLKNAGHDPFFDVHNIPRGTPFPESIRQAATQAKVGVVVLSDEFMLSKWPMIELELLRNFSEKVMPLFYKLIPKDLKDPTKLSAWKTKWDEMALKDETIVVSRWEEAVEWLDSQAGEVYISGTSEGAYIKNITRKICEKLPPVLLYDVTDAKGQERLVKEVKDRFQHALEAGQSSSNTLIIGMHAVGGLGKSTLCKVMANSYMPSCCGKSAVIKFPSRVDENTIVMECKYALKQLTCTHDSLLDGAHDFGQVVQLMKERMKSETVFLALDNVWEHSREEARQLLEVGFGVDSRVLVTSRSQRLLEVLLGKACVSPLPSVNKGEALETFQASFGADLSLISRKPLDRVVSLCLLDGSYHCLALKALGGRLKSIMRGVSSDVSEIERNLSELTFSLKDSKIEDLIMSNYDGMKDIAQRMFLDVAVIFRRTGSFVRTYDLQMRHKEMCEWLSILYECAKDEIIEQVDQLGLYGLLQIEEEKHPIFKQEEHFKRRVVVHDLYLDLAERLAAASPRILVAGSKGMEVVRWAELERVVLDSKSEDAVEMVLQDCPKLQVLYASEQTFSKGLQLNGARALLLLKVKNCIGEVSGLKDVRKLAALQFVHDDVEVGHKAHAGFRALLFRKVKNCIGQFNHDDVEVRHRAQAGFRALRDVSSGELQSLVLRGEACFYGAKDKAGYLCTLRNLRTLQLEGWAGLKKLPDLTASVHLERLEICRSEALEEEIEGSLLPPSLEHMVFYDCPRLQRIADLGGCARLTSLLILTCGSLEEIQGFPPNLERLMLYDCASLNRIPDLLLQAQLRTLQVACRSLKEIRGVLQSNLERIFLWDCASLQRIPDLDRRAQLRKLFVIQCGSLEEIPWLLPPNLQMIALKNCKRLQKIPDLNGLAQLRHVDVRACGPLVKDQVRGFSFDQMC